MREQPCTQLAYELPADALSLVLLQEVDRIQLASVGHVVHARRTAAQKPDNAVCLVLGDECDRGLVCNADAPGAFSLAVVV